MPISYHQNDDGAQIARNGAFRDTTGFSNLTRLLLFAGLTCGLGVALLIGCGGGRGGNYSGDYSAFLKPARPVLLPPDRRLVVALDLGGRQEWARPIEEAAREWEAAGGGA